MPFGLQQLDWDQEAPSLEQLHRLLAHFSSADQSHDSVVAFCCKADHVGTVRDAIQRQGSFNSWVGEVYWAKEDFVAVGQTQALLKRVEVSVMARWVSHTEERRPLSVDLRNCGNVIEGKQYKTTYKHKVN